MIWPVTCMVVWPIILALFLQIPVPSLGYCLLSNFHCIFLPQSYFASDGEPNFPFLPNGQVFHGLRRSTGLSSWVLKSLEGVIGGASPGTL